MATIFIERKKRALSQSQFGPIFLKFGVRVPWQCTRFMFKNQRSMSSTYGRKCAETGSLVNEMR